MSTRTKQRHTFVATKVRLPNGKTADAFEWETLKSVDRFNNRRLLQPIGNISPAEAEAAFLEQRGKFGKVA